MTLYQSLVDKIKMADFVWTDRKSRISGDNPKMVSVAILFLEDRFIDMLIAYAL